MMWLEDSVIYLTKAGSNAYGMATNTSDCDIKGICIPPEEVNENLFFRFEQTENHPFIDKMYSHLKNPNNPKLESCVYSLKKYFSLAAQINPNIVELLWTDTSDHLYCHSIMEKLFQNRGLFLSSKAKYTFSGYAWSQLNRIERHRKWIVKGDDVKKPERADFGLSPVMSRKTQELFDFIKSEVERWNLSKFGLDSLSCSELKETIWEMIAYISQVKVGWDNWPQVYEMGVIKKLEEQLGLDEKLVDLIKRESQYKRALNEYQSWVKWKEERNPERYKLETKCGYDSKHAAHLVRLLRMGYEILTEGKVIVKRPDFEELLHIRNGGWTFDQLIEYAFQMQSKLEDAYSKTKLPKSVDYDKINRFYHQLLKEYYQNYSNQSE